MNIKDTIKYSLFLGISVITLGVFNVQAAAVTKDEIIDLTNAEREKIGLQPLVENEALDKAAFLKAQDMIGNNYFAHTSPNGIDPWYWFEKAGYTYKYAGENLAMDFQNAISVHRAWMKSKTHKDNIISSKFQEIGVAVVGGIMEGKETQIAVQLFGTRLAGVDGRENVEIEKVKGESENSIEVQIKKASMSPWEGSFEDEMLIFTEAEGNPKKVELIANDQSYDLEKLRDGMYMNLISLKDINLAQDQLTIKATADAGNAVFYQVPKDSFNEYLAKKENKNEDDENKVAFAGSSDSNDSLSNILYPFNPNNLLLVILGVFLVTIANVWVLEKEEEKLLKSANAL